MTYFGSESINFARLLRRVLGGISQFALLIGRASADRTYPGGLPRFDRTSSHSPAALTTLSRVPVPICEITRAVDDAFS